MTNIKQLYEKAKEIETQITSADYKGNPGSVNRLLEISEKLDKKIPDVMVVRVPKFTAITTGDLSWEDMFKEGGGMNQLWSHKHLFRHIIFDCPDFLLLKNEQAECLCAVSENVTATEVSPLAIIEFEGGLYAMSVCIDNDDESIGKVEKKISRWLEGTSFLRDKNRYVMCTMPYTSENNNEDIKIGLGYEQLLRFIPIKLKENL